MKNHPEHSNKSISRKNKNFYELSVSLIFSLWCLVFLFYTRLGHSHGKQDAYIDDGNSKRSSQKLLESDRYFDSNSSTDINHNSVHSGYSVQQKKRLEEVIKDFLGTHADLECKVEEKIQSIKPEEELMNKILSSSSNLDPDNLKNTTMSKKGSVMPGQRGNITRKLEPGESEYNYASSSKGAKVLAHNKEANGASNILGSDKDRYLRNPCSVDKKFVIIELAEETLVDTVEIANCEHYSSNFKDFELWGSLTYPMEAWILLGNFVAQNVKHAQKFTLKEPKWVRYLKLNLTSHYGSEFYCTLSSVQVYGVDAIKWMLEDLIVVSDKPTTDQSSTSIPVATISSRAEAASTEKVEIAQGHGLADPHVTGMDIFERQNLDAPPNTKNEVLMSNVPDPVKEVRQQPNGRIASDTVLMILMQKVRSLELNLSVIEGHIKEVNRRYSNVLPDLERDLSRNAFLLEETKSKIMDIMEWKEAVDKRTTELESWKSIVTSQMDALVKDNKFLRSSIEKISSDRSRFENKELAVLTVSFFFVCVSFLKLVLDKILVFFRAFESHRLCSTSRGWLLILVSSSMTTLITLLYE